MKNVLRVSQPTIIAWVDQAAQFKGNEVYIYYAACESMHWTELNLVRGGGMRRPASSPCIDSTSTSTYAYLNLIKA